MEIKIKKRRKEKVVQELHGRGGSRTAVDDRPTGRLGVLSKNTCPGGHQKKKSVLKEQVS